jgi:hypothetical protein
MKERRAEERSFHLASIISLWQLLYWIDNKEKHHYATKEQRSGFFTSFISRSLYPLLYIVHMTQLKTVSGLCSLTFYKRQ